ncbi:hypothetical protein N9L68_03950 [bacterium]|nr:hypothetical protein [bacterium]
MIRWGAGSGDDLLRIYYGHMADLSNIYLGFSKDALRNGTRRQFILVLSLIVLLLLLVLSVTLLLFVNHWMIIIIMSMLVSKANGEQMLWQM